MSIQYDEKGKFFTDVVTKVPVRSLVQTTAQLLRGNIHVREGERFKDELDRPEAFLAMTEVSILAADGQVQYRSAFLAVQRSQIVWAFPDEPEHEARS